MKKLIHPKSKLIFEIDGIQLFVQLRQYIVKVKGAGKTSLLIHYCSDLEDALEDMIDLMERRHLSRGVWRSAKSLLKAVEEVHQKFWKEVELAKLK